MPTVVKTRIIKIGNSQGIRIPKLLLEQTNLGEEVELEMQENRIVIRPSQTTRQNWEAQFQFMAEKGDDKLLEEALLATAWEDEEWEW